MLYDGNGNGDGDGDGDGGGDGVGHCTGQHIDKEVGYVNVKASTDLEPPIGQSFHKLRVFHRSKASRGRYSP